MKTKRVVSRLTTVAFVASLPMAAGACGFIFMHGPPSGHEQMEYFTCTESNTGAVLDVIWAGLNGLGAASSGGDAAVIGAGLTWLVVSGAAAITGFNKSERCRAAKRQMAERQAQRRGPRIEPAVTDVVVEAVVISPAADTLTIGERVQLVATAYSSGGAVIADKMFTWSSSNFAIASVSSAGLVTAHATGAVVIAARTDNVVGTANILVVSRR